MQREENTAQNRGKQSMRRGKKTMNDEENAVQIVVEEEEEMVDTIHQGNSDSVPLDNSCTVSLHCRLHTRRRRHIEKRGKSSTFLLNSVQDYRFKAEQRRFERSPPSGFPTQDQKNR